MTVSLASIKNKIVKEFGSHAFDMISVGHPDFIELDHSTLIVFWMAGYECEVYLDTDPHLIRQVETDKEFTSFAHLWEEIYGEPYHCPTV